MVEKDQMSLLDVMGVQVADTSEKKPKTAVEALQDGEEAAPAAKAKPARKAKAKPAKEKPAAEAPETEATAPQIDAADESAAQAPAEEATGDPVTEAPSEDGSSEAPFPSSAEAQTTSDLEAADEPEAASTPSAIDDEIETDVAVEAEAEAGTEDEPDLEPDSEAEPTPEEPFQIEGPISLDRFVCFSLYSANHAMTRVYRPLLQKLGLTYPQYLAMVVLWEKNDQLVGDIGARLHLESNTITPLLKRLESLGFITRERSLKDERQVRVKLTRKGHALKAKTKDFAGCIVSASGVSLQELSDLQLRISELRNNLLRAEAEAEKA